MVRAWFLGLFRRLYGLGSQFNSLYDPLTVLMALPFSVSARSSRSG